MRFPSCFAVLAASVLLFLGSASAQVQMEDEILGFVDAHHRPVTDPMWPTTELSALTGFASDVSINPANTCFSGNPEEIFVGGETVALNVIFEDNIEADQFNQYNVTWAMQFRGVRIPLGTFACDSEVTQFPAGTPWTFCCVLTQFIPESPLPIPISLSVHWGARVVKVENGDTVQEILGQNISVNR